MSNCRDIEQDLSALIDGELPGERQAEVIEHVDQCPQCSQRVVELQKLVAGIAALPAAETPPQFLADVRRKLRQPEQSSWVDSLFRPVWWKVPLEAMALVLVVVGVVVFLRPSRPPVAVARAERVGVTAKILPSTPAEGMAEEKRDSRLAALDSAPAVRHATDGQPAVAALEASGKRPELPESLVIRGDSVVAVRVRMENLAKDLHGRLESAAPSNVFMVYLPATNVAAFRSQATGAKAAVSYAASRPAATESVVVVEVRVEP
ncbi:MAG: hypothetical protein PCFJNLEI_01943 [Verrucomicrobiae bacterium]|nr:hypothetical protein [Verrucomicrobiae bacterium]